MDTERRTPLSKKDKNTDGKIAKKVKKLIKSQDHVLRSLLLGAGESGKSTVMKQMQLIHGEGFKEDDREDVKPDIVRNILEGATSVVNATKAPFGFPLEDEDSIKAGDLVIAKYKANDLDEFLEENIVQALFKLKEDPNFQKTIDNRAKFQLLESWDVFMQKLESYPDWGGEDWTPSEEDVLLARVRTTGINEVGFQIENANLRIIDVGGQRAERKKWMKLFQGVSSVIFVAAISEYNQVLYEDAKVNRLEEALNLWRETFNRPAFHETAFLLFLNKFDLFQEKYLKQHIPIEYDGEYAKNVPAPSWDQEEDDKCEMACSWFRGLFKYQVSQERWGDIYIHVTTALDKEHMQVVMDTATAHILRRNLAGMFAGI